MFIHNFNFDEKTLIWFKKFTKKESNCINFSKNQDQIKTKRTDNQFDNFERIETKRVIPTF